MNKRKNIYHNLCLKCETYDHLNKFRKNGEDNSTFINRICDILDEQKNTKIINIRGKRSESRRR